MQTFQDLLEVGADEGQRGKFCRDAVDAFRVTEEYARAAEGEAYYNKHNLTIEAYQKYLYTLSGSKTPDIFSANYKLKTLFFRRLVSQQVQYVLGNGLTLAKVKNKAKLGKDFDFKLQTAAKRAMASGRAFGFWNLDHLEVFGYADTPAEPGFCPLYDETTGELRAGIRFWFRRVDSKTIFRGTLYEEDGYTEYKQADDGEPVEVIAAKRAYKITKKQNAAGDISDEIGENYTSLPIVALYANDSHESELVGIRECIDCYDFIKSGLANDIDDTSGFYWVIKNTGAMDDTDLAKFVQRMKSVRAATVDGNADTNIDAHTMEIPTDARRLMLEMLRADIYEDFQALDVKTLSAAAKTTQEIQAAYQAQDNKCADFEYYMVDFVQRILEIAQIDDTPTFNWNRVINQSEQTSMILSAANYLTDEAIIKHLPFLTPEEADAIIKDRTSEAMQRFNDTEEEENDEETDENADETAQKAQEGAESEEGEEVNTEAETGENKA